MEDYIAWLDGSSVARDVSPAVLEFRVQQLEAERAELASWLDTQDFYELCQTYRHARDGVPLAPSLLTAAEAYDALKAALLARLGNA